MKKIIIKQKNSKLNELSTLITRILKSIFINKSSNIVFYKYKSINIKENKYLNKKYVKFNNTAKKNKLKKNNLSNLGNYLKLKKHFFYIFSVILVPFFVIIIIFLIYVNNSIFFSVVLAYEYKILSYEDIIDLDNDNIITTLSAEEGVTVSDYTTGTKIVGEKAQGKISVFNATSEVVVIKAGTKVTCISSSCNGLEYVAVNDLNIGPGSASDLEIIASDIGVEFNIAINAGRFKIGNFDPNVEIVASNIRPIQGGTIKKTIMIVSKEDIERLQNKALEELKILLRSKIIYDPNYVNKYVFLKESDIKISNITVDGDKEGDEKDIFNLTVKANGELNAISNSKIIPKIQEMKLKVTPNGYFIDDKSFNYSVQALYNNSNNRPYLQVKLNGIMRLIVDIEYIKNQIKQKRLNEAVKFLENLSNLKVLEMVYTPEFIPEYFRFIPADTNRIRIQVIALDPSK